MTDNANFDELPLELLAETESYAVLLGEDLEGEPVYNIEMGSITLHLFEDEWTELVELISKVRR